MARQSSVSETEFFKREISAELNGGPPSGSNQAATSFSGSGGSGRHVRERVRRPHRAQMRAFRTVGGC